MFQLIGILVLVNFLVGAVWWFAQIRARTAGRVALAGLALVVGLTAVFHQRLRELVRADMGNTSAAAGQVREAAAVVAKLRVQLESELDELKRRSEKSASAEVTELRETLAAHNAEIARLTRQVEETRKRSAEPESPIAAGALPKSREILPPPQARSRTGETVEQAALLKQRFEEAIDRHKEGQHHLAYVAAQACVELYESSRDAGQKDGPDLGGVTTDGAAAIYSVAAEICQRVDQHERALDWARRAVALHPSPERKALLATTCLNLKLREEADKIIEEANSGYDPASLELRKLLTDFGIIKAARK